MERGGSDASLADVSSGTKDISTGTSTTSAGIFIIGPLAGDIITSRSSVVEKTIILSVLEAL